MVERSRDSSRDLLEELEDGWGTPRPPAAAVSANAAQAEAARDASSPDLAELDDGWLDDLFPNEPEDEEEEEPEPELPDERADPVAYAEAKAAREDRAAKKKEKRRAKAEAKRARQKARAAAMRQKQKAKKARPAGARRDEPSSRSVAEVTPRTRAADAPRPTDDEAEDIATAAAVVSKQASPAPRKPSTAASIKLLAIVLAALLALAAAVAALAK